MQINYFWGDLTDVSAKKEALIINRNSAIRSNFRYTTYGWLRASSTHVDTRFSAKGEWKNRDRMVHNTLYGRTGKSEWNFTMAKQQKDLLWR